MLFGIIANGADPEPPPKFTPTAEDDLFSDDDDLKGPAKLWRRTLAAQARLHAAAAPPPPAVLAAEMFLGRLTIVDTEFIEPGPPLPVPSLTLIRKRQPQTKHYEKQLEAIKAEMQRDMLLHATGGEPNTSLADEAFRKARPTKDGGTEYLPKQTPVVTRKLDRQTKIKRSTQ